MQIELKRKTIDPSTGSDVVEKRIFKLNASGDPTESIVFHQTADLLGISVFDRTNPHVYRKLAIIYNWASDYAKSNEAEKVVSVIEKYKNKLNLNVRGTELLDSMYRNIRLEVDRAESLKRYEEKQKGIKEISKDFSSDSKRTQELKGEISEQAASHKRLSVEAEKGREKAIEAWNKSLLREKNIKLKVVEDTPHEVEQLK